MCNTLTYTVTFPQMTNQTSTKYYQKKKKKINWFTLPNFDTQFQNELTHCYCS